METNQDHQRDLQLADHLDEHSADNSTCCDAPMIENTDLCSDCKEHSQSYRDMYEQSMSDRMEADKERGYDLH